VYGKVRIKQSYFNGDLVRSKPEYDDCKKLARKHKISIADIENAVKHLAK